MFLPDLPVAAGLRRRGRRGAAGRRRRDQLGVPAVDDGDHARAAGRAAGRPGARDRRRAPATTPRCWPASSAPTGSVTAVDIDAELIDSAARHLAAAGVTGVRLVCADGALGHPPDAPYDRIVLTVGSSDVRPEWVAQLAPGGRLLLPLALRGSQLSVALDLGPDGAAAQRLGARLRVHPAARHRRRPGHRAAGRRAAARCRCRRTPTGAAGPGGWWPRRWPRPARCGRPGWRSGRRTCGTASGSGSRCTIRARSGCCATTSRRARRRRPGPDRPGRGGGDVPDRRRVRRGGAGRAGSRGGRRRAGWAAGTGGRGAAGVHAFGPDGAVPAAAAAGRAGRLGRRGPAPGRRAAAGRRAAPGRRSSRSRGRWSRCPAPWSPRLAGRLSIGPREGLP